MRTLASFQTYNMRGINLGMGYYMGIFIYGTSLGQGIHTLKWHFKEEDSVQLLNIILKLNSNS